MLRNSNKDGTINPDKNISLKLNSVNKEPCDSCADVKARQKIVPKKIEHKPATNYDIDRNRSTNIWRAEVLKEVFYTTTLIEKYI